jgi:hypothetical protein
VYGVMIRKFVDTATSFRVSICYAYLDCTISYLVDLSLRNLARSFTFFAKMPDLSLFNSPAPYHIIVGISNQAPYFASIIDKLHRPMVLSSVPRSFSLSSLE